MPSTATLESRLRRRIVEVSIPGLVTKTPNGSHGHWRARYARSKLERDTAALMLRNAHSEAPGLPAVVTMTRCAPHELDDDNLASSFKSIRDGVADWLGINDRDQRVTWRVEQRKCKRVEAGTVIRIEGRT